MAKVANHAHCNVCGKAIPAGDTFCSKACKDEAQEQEDKRKRMLYLMYGLFIAGFLLLVVLPLFTGNV